MKKLVLALLLVTLTLPVAAGQTPDLGELMADYARRQEDNNSAMLVVHLNDYTTEALFGPPLQYTLRAQARMNVIFYVQGEAKRDVELDTDFRFRQGGLEYRTTPVNIENFEDGYLRSGDQFEGVLQVNGPLNLRIPFTVWNIAFERADQRMEFELSSDAYGRITP